MACEVCHEIYTPIEGDEADSDVKPHLCTTCGQSFSLKIQLKRHVLLHADGAPYTCKNCAKVNDMKGKTYNLRLGNKNEYICDICQKSFNNKRMLLRHSIQHTFDRTSDTEESYEKEKIVKKHVTPYKSKHLGRKSADKTELLSCKICEKSFQSWLSLEKHTLTHNVTKSAKTLFCQTCNRGFAYQACLDKHIKKGKCNYAQPVSVSKSSVKQSKNVVLETDKKHTCNVCGKTFARKSSLEGHELSHILDKETSEEEKGLSDGDESDEYITQPKKSRTSTFKFQKSYTCDKCNFVCFSKQTLNKHTTNHKEKEVVMSDANEEETYSDDGNAEHSVTSDRGNSVVTETEEIKVNDSNFECKKCGKKFRTEEKLHKHDLLHIRREKEELRTEEEQGSFLCEICDKKFFSKKSLKQHLLFHVERSPSDPDADKNVSWGKQRRQRSKNFVCEVCGRRFAGETCLKKHYLKHEQKEENYETKHTRPSSAKVKEENFETKQSRPSSAKVKKPKPMKELICEFCNEEFTGKRAAYMKHIHAHTPEVCGICDERFVDRQSLREHCKIHVGTEEGRMFMQCSQKALDAKNGLLPPEPKVEYIYLVLR